MERRTFLQGSVLSAGALAAGAPIASAASPLRVHVLAYDGVEELDFIAPLDVLAKAAFKGGAVRTTLVSPDKPGFVRATTGVRFEIPGGWSPTDADVLVVPGGGPHNLPGSGLHRLINDKAFMRRLSQFKGVKAGVCTGVMALSAAGFTRGRPATTHAIAKADLAAQGATVVSARVVDDGDLVTCGGITSGLDLGLWLVERYLGPRLAVDVETMLEYERRGTVWQSQRT